jgi:hypothetical protein
MSNLYNTRSLWIKPLVDADEYDLKLVLCDEDILCKNGWFYNLVVDFTVQINDGAVLDFETRNIHILEFPVHFSRTTEYHNLTIRLLDVNEAPVFLQNLYVLDYKENTEVNVYDK